MKKRYFFFSLLIVLLASAGGIYFKTAQTPSTTATESRAFNELCKQRFNAFVQKVGQDCSFPDSTVLAALPLFSDSLRADLAALPNVDEEKLYFQAFYDLGLGRYYAYQNGDARVLKEHELELEVLNSFKKVQACVLNKKVKHGTSWLAWDRLYLSMHELQ